MTTFQNAIDRIVWALYARPRANPSYVEVVTVADALKASGALTAPGSGGHYLLDRHVPRDAMQFGDGLIGTEDIPPTRLTQLAAGAPPTPQESLLWQRRWTQRALQAPAEHDLPNYNIGTVRARSGEQVYWLATIEGADAYLGVELFGFACSLEEIFSRFRATVIAATVPVEIRDALCR